MSYLFIPSHHPKALASFRRAMSLNNWPTDQLAVCQSKSSCIVIIIITIAIAINNDIIIITRHIFPLFRNWFSLIVNVIVVSSLPPSALRLVHKERINGITKTVDLISFPPSKLPCLYCPLALLDERRRGRRRQTTDSSYFLLFGFFAAEYKGGPLNKHQYQRIASHCIFPFYSFLYMVSWVSFSFPICCCCSCLASLLCFIF